MKNVDSTVLKNKYYPKGLTEDSIKRYYELNRDKILKYTNALNTPIVIFLIDNSGKEIVKRHHNGKLIYLDNGNYDTLFNGRTVSAAAELRPRTRKFVLDLDAKSASISEETKKSAVEKCLETLKELSEKSILSKVPPKVYITSSGYHIHGTYSKTLLLEKLDLYMRNYLADFSEYMVQYGMKLDFSTMKSRGAHTIPGCLNRNGLVCADVTDSYKTVKRSNFRILY